MQRGHRHSTADGPPVTTPDSTPAHHNNTSRNPAKGTANVPSTNITPECEPLQPCSDYDAFFENLDQIDLSDLEQKLCEGSVDGVPPTVISESVDQYPGEGLTAGHPKEYKRRGPKTMPPLPFVKLRLWSMYPGIKAPRRLGTLYTQHLAKPGSDLATRCGFTGRIPDRGTTRARFKRLDEYPDLIREALRAISLMRVRHYLMPPDPGPQTKPENPIQRNRTGEKNAHQKRLEDEALGQEEFAELFRTQEQVEEFLLKHLHGNDIRCHHCVAGRRSCAPCAGDQVVEYPPRIPKCPNPARHTQHDTHEPRRQWRCQCCRSYLSVTSGTLLDSVKLPLRTILRCLHKHGGGAIWVSRGSDEKETQPAA